MDSKSSVVTMNNQANDWFCSWMNICDGCQHMTYDSLQTSWCNHLMCLPCVRKFHGCPACEKRNVGHQLLYTWNCICEVTPDPKLGFESIIRSIIWGCEKSLVPSIELYIMYNDGKKFYILLPTSDACDKYSRPLLDRGLGGMVEMILDHFMLARYRNNVLWGLSFADTNLLDRFKETSWDQLESELCFTPKVDLDERETILEL